MRVRVLQILRLGRVLDRAEASQALLEDVYPQRVDPGDENVQAQVELLLIDEVRVRNVPLDEALSRVVIDFSGRPGLDMKVDFTRAAIGRLDTQLFWEFFQGFVNHAKVTLHIDNLKGFNAHHQAETIFKAFGRALRMAVEQDPRMAGVTPSTKGSL